HDARPFRPLLTFTNSLCKRRRSRQLSSSHAQTCIQRLVVARILMSVKPDLGSLIDHIVIIVKENHTFDNYFGTFPGADGAKLAAAQNPPPDDPNHRHEAWEARATDTVHKVQYGEHDIPPYFALPRPYTLSHPYFSALPAPST